MLHVADAAKEYTSVTIRTVDSDVVVLAVYVFGQLSTSLTELWVAFGTGKNYRMISAHGIYAGIGVDKCLAVRNIIIVSYYSLDFNISYDVMKE